MVRAAGPSREDARLSATHLRIARIGRPHGVAGELKVRPHFEGSDSLRHADRVVVVTQSGARELTVERVRGRGEEPIVSFAGVHGRDAADQLKGGDLWIPREALPCLEPGEYYLVDLVGCEVLCGSASLGRVVSVRPDPSVDTMVIERTDGTWVEQPIVDAFLERVDVKAGVVVLLNLDGLID